MIQYDYLENQSLNDLNSAGQNGWQVISITGNATPSGFNAFVMKGFQEKTLIEDGARSFWYSNTMTAGEAMILTFLTIAFFVMVGTLIFKFVFRK